MEGTLGHLHCNALCHPARQRCHCAKTVNASEQNAWYLDTIPIKVTYQIKLHPACILLSQIFVCPNTCRPSWPAQNWEGSAEIQSQYKTHMDTSSVASELFGIVLEGISAGTNSAVTGAAWEGVGGNHPYSSPAGLMKLINYHQHLHCQLRASEIPALEQPFTTSRLRSILPCTRTHTLNQLDMEIFCELFFRAIFLLPPSVTA